jgi:ABC-type uncharacterized transport system auxiliary subunit
LTASRPETRYYALALRPPQTAAFTPIASLVIRPFTARDPYDQERIVYRSSPYVVDFYNYHRWSSSPAEQATEWARQYLRTSGLFTKVFPTSEGEADFVLGGVIRQFEEIDHEQTWEAALQVDFWLTRRGEHSPFWFQSYGATQQALRRNPEAVAEAMSRNLEQVLARLTSDLTQIIAGTPK